MDDHKATDIRIPVRRTEGASAGCSALYFTPPANYQMPCGPGGLGTLHHKPPNNITDKQECTNVGRSGVSTLILVRRQNFGSWSEPQKPFRSCDKRGNCSPGPGRTSSQTLHSVTEPTRRQSLRLRGQRSLCRPTARPRCVVIYRASSVCRGYRTSGSRVPNTCPTQKASCLFLQMWKRRSREVG